MILSSDAEVLVAAAAVAVAVELSSLGCLTQE